MAYRKKIKANIFSPSSIENAIKELEAEKENIKKLNTEFLNKLGAKMVVFLRSCYNSSEDGGFLIEHQVSGNTVTITAEGEGLLFVEFGTGTPADQSKGKDYGYGAGTWSSWHANTYERWLNFGEFAKADGSYRYDSDAKDAFLQLETHLHDMIYETAREVFK